jgi:hypothetical protein
VANGGRDWSRGDAGGLWCASRQSVWRIGMALAALALCLQLLLPSMHLAMVPGSSADRDSGFLALDEHAICRSTDSDDVSRETPADKAPSQGKHACGVLCWCPWGAGFVLPAPTSVLRVAFRKLDAGFAGPAFVIIIPARLSGAAGARAPPVRA